MSFAWWTEIEEYLRLKGLLNSISNEKTRCSSSFSQLSIVHRQLCAYSIEEINKLLSSLAADAIEALFCLSEVSICSIQARLESRDFFRQSLCIFIRLRDDSHTLVEFLFDGFQISDFARVLLLEALQIIDCLGCFSVNLTFCVKDLCQFEYDLVLAKLLIVCIVVLAEVNSLVDEDTFNLLVNTMSKFLDLHTR